MAIDTLAPAHFGRLLREFGAPAAAPVQVAPAPGVNPGASAPQL